MFQSLFAVINKDAVDVNVYMFKFAAACPDSKNKEHELHIQKEILGKTDGEENVQRPRSCYMALPEETDAAGMRVRVTTTTGTVTVVPFWFS